MLYFISAIIPYTYYIAYTNVIHTFITDVISILALFDKIYDNIIIIIHNKYESAVTTVCFAVYRSD